jgi:hypothetical protein
MGSLHEDVSTFFTIPRLIPLKMKNVLDKICTENGYTNVPQCYVISTLPVLFFMILHIIC